MKLSIAWLRELVDFPVDLDEVTDRLTLLGLEVEGVDPVRLAFPGVRVGHVLEAGPHPGADRLILCQVATGSEVVPVVCGAPNVRAGLKVAMALPGSVLPGDVKIKKTRIRGETSMGMICSERELGLGQGHTGILELPDDYELGRELDAYLGYDDTAVEVEVTPNRPDLLSHLGVAREIAAFYRTEVRWPEAGADVSPVEEDRGYRVRILDGEGCPRFTARLMDGISVGVAPVWMRHRLVAIGQRPINAVVDASNYVLHECGQPTHVFDRSKLRGAEILLRKATAQEPFTTLDDVERRLDSHHLLVADTEGPIALAGIMGGANSEVDDSTTDVLLEVAYFDPRTIRRGRRSLNLVTDASYRFERGVDFELLPWASRRLGHLIQETAGGTPSNRLIEARGESLPAAAQFFVRASQVERVVGARLEAEEMAAILQRLEIPAKSASRDGAAGVEVLQPSFRHDLLEEVDAVEELARHYGYDRIPTVDKAPMLTPARRTPSERFRRRLREMFAGRGYHEVVASSFMRDGDLHALDLADDDRRRRTVEVLNPVAQGESRLRSTALPEMLRTVGRNRSRGYRGPIRMFQLSRCFVGRDSDPLPEEPEALVVVWNGAAHPPHFLEPVRPFDLYDALGEVEGLLASFGVAVSRAEEANEPYLRLGASAVLQASGGPLGVLGELSPVVARRFDLRDVTLVAELGLGALERALPGRRDYRPVSPYPPVKRDLSLVVTRTLEYRKILDRLEDVLGEVLESVEVFDLYQGPGLEEGEQALGIRLVLRSEKGTLKDKKVDGLLGRLLEDLHTRYGVRLRA